MNTDVRVRGIGCSWIPDQVRDDGLLGPSIFAPGLLAGLEQVPERAVLERELLGAEQQGALGLGRGVGDLAEQGGFAEPAGAGIDAEAFGGGIEHRSDRHPVGGEGERRAERAAAPVGLGEGGERAALGEDRGFAAGRRRACSASARRRRRGG